MKTIALTILHYGKPYLGWAMQSLIDYVDEYWILYSPTPSHNGGRASLPCPDSEWELHDIATTVAGSKLQWVTGDWKIEGQQRDAIYSLCPDADVILVADYDEVWPNTMAERAIKRAIQYPTIRYFRAEMVHYWRSFYRCILHDPAYPIRVIRPNAIHDKAFYLDIHRHQHTEGIDHRLMINHLGYAIPINYMAYKWSGIHGHQNELRPDWFHDVFLPNRQHDTHPVGSEHWNPETVDPWLYMPAFMKSHPYAKLEVIE